eukprot:Protomagalhaensia_wolfi_Nauph_80__4380@NODE_447_length_2512_cov_305_625152_g337_i0_p1_GENE_NODE_447_length_2512_cov_305_625152_g337_i0NODE_447_length_2512_cov_305_625152_g337_i0_p1_ORF_typecomplete_len541_score85_45UDPGT/PF00201_18/3_6e34Glyco_tran_28_C/PF04101_16/0_0023_NODE_447_length_2512_cov_305_625152_g337_i08032425
MIESTVATRASTPQPDKRSADHIVMCNALGVGHYQPMKSFVHLLATSGGLPINITFFAVVRHNEASKCTPLERECDENVSYRQVVLEGEDVHPVTMKAMVTRKLTLTEMLEQEIKSVQHKRRWASPRAIVHDPFALFAREAATRLRLPCILFNPSNCFFWGLFSLPRFIERVLAGDNAIPVAPDSSLTVRAQLMWTMMRSEASTPPEDREPVLKECTNVREIFSHACAVVGNDVRALYPWAISRAQSGMKLEADPQAQPSPLKMEYFCVSPLCVLETPSLTTNAPELGLIKGSESLREWMDKKDAQSVIYIALGTLYAMRREVLCALFEALLQSPFSFVWSYSERHNPPALSAEMLQRLDSSKGVIVPWTRQKELLMHPAVRLFVSHCGWNSTIENLCLAGIPMLCVPLGSDQVPNTMLLCDILGCGRLGMVEDPAWAQEDWESRKQEFEDKVVDVRRVWEEAATRPVKYKFPDAADGFLSLLMDASSTHYIELRLKAKEAQTLVLKAATLRGDMASDTEKFKRFVASLPSTKEINEKSM